MSQSATRQNPAIENSLRSLLVAEARLPSPVSASIIHDICEHLTGHGARLTKEGERSILTYEFGRGEVEPDQHGVTLRVEAFTQTGLAELKADLAGHFIEFMQGDVPEIVWTGDGSDLTSPPPFRVMTVVRAQNITPHMRRITLTCDDIDRYCVSESLHVNMLFPQPGIDPEWPVLGRDGLVKWPQGPGKTILRKYTIRGFDLGARTIDVDFVIHENAGPGSGWAAKAGPGDNVGFYGPGGGSFGEADWYLLAGDETALPAIARILENLPPSARGVAFIEVADVREEQAINYNAQVELHWFHRNGAATGTTTTLQDAVRAAEWPNDESTIFVWAAAEFETFKSIRSYLRKERGLPRDQHYVLPYWRRGDSVSSAFERMHELDEDEKSTNAGR
jgi:NADPH-dependent ferric siderophore reductase